LATSQPLSGLDRFFLEAESPEGPAHSGALQFLGAGPLVTEHGVIDWPRVLTFVAARLDGIPLMRRRLASVPYGLSGPVWIDDVDFDVTRHLRPADLPNGCTEAEAQVYFQRFLTGPFDPAHPLWRAELTTLDDGRVVQFSKVHHALMDGQSGLAVMAAFYDLSPDLPEVHPSTWRPARVGPRRLAVDAVVRRLRDPGPRRRIVGLLRRPVQLVQLVRATRGSAPGPADAPEWMPDRFDLRGDLSRERAFERRDLALDDVAAARAATGATATGILLGMVAGGMRSLLAARGHDLSGATVNVLVPQAFGASGLELGNWTGALVVPVDVGEPDPRVRMASAIAALESAKAGEIEVGLVPDVTLSSMRGLDVPLYSFGSRVLASYSGLCLMGDLRLGIAAISDGEAMRVGVTGDGTAFPDLSVLADSMLAELAQAQEAAA
jgi:diacylglycerol O-acyltransferase